MAHILNSSDNFHETINVNKFRMFFSQQIQTFKLHFIISIIGFGFLSVYVFLIFIFFIPMGIIS